MRSRKFARYLGAGALAVLAVMAPAANLPDDDVSSQLPASGTTITAPTPLTATLSGYGQIVISGDLDAMPTDPVRVAGSAANVGLGTLKAESGLRFVRLTECGTTVRQVYVGTVMVPNSNPPAFSVFFIDPPTTTRVRDDMVPVQNLVDALWNYVLVGDHWQTAVSSVLPSEPVPVAASKAVTVTQPGSGFNAVIHSTPELTAAGVHLLAKVLEQMVKDQAPVPGRTKTFDDTDRDLLLDALSLTDKPVLLDEPLPNTFDSEIWTPLLGGVVPVRFDLQQAPLMAAIAKNPQGKIVIRVERKP